MWIKLEAKVDLLQQFLELETDPKKYIQKQKANRKSIKYISAIVSKQKIPRKKILLTLKYLKINT